MRVLTVSGSRADYGLLSGPMRAMAAEPALDPRLVLTGSHVDSRFGGTRSEIEADGFSIHGEIALGFDSDTPRGIVEACGRVLTAAAPVIDELAPDILLLLGDRYEIFAVAAAAALMGVPIAHVHGGEATYGAIDDSLRHAISKLSNLHFAAAEVYRRRLIQMGELPGLVHTVGAPGVELALKSKIATSAELWERVGTNLPEPLGIVTYHPETTGAPDPARDIEQLLDALDSSDLAGLLFTGVNADARRDEVDDAISKFVVARPGRTAAVDNLGQRLYWTAMRHSVAVIGNSSSGIIEAPSLKVPTINMGTRQAGRLRAKSIVDCAPDSSEIGAAIKRVLAGKVHLDETPPYEGNDTSLQIANILAGTDPSALLPKPFADLDFGSVAA